MKMSAMIENFGIESFASEQRVADALEISLGDSVAWCNGDDIDDADLRGADEAFIKFAVQNGASASEAKKMLEDFQAYEFIYDKMGW